MGERAVNLCGLKVRENAALIEAAALFIGHDSGPMHMAAAVGTPLVAVFSRLWVRGIWYPMSPRAVVLYPGGGHENASPLEGEVGAERRAGGDVTTGRFAGIEAQAEAFSPARQRFASPTSPSRGEALHESIRLITVPAILDAVRTLLADTP
jgi:hypothetical protein